MVTRVQTRTKYFPLGGGLDVVTSAISVKPGKALNMLNYEPWYIGGYRRIPGFERFDGRPKPSEQSFTGFAVNSAADITAGATVVGDTSGATGLVVATHENTDKYENDSVGVTKVTGAFAEGEELTVSVTGAVKEMRPNAAPTGTVSILDPNDFSLISEGTDNADGTVIKTTTNDITGSTVTWGLSDVITTATAINSYTLRVRAKITRSAPPGSFYSKGPEADDTVTYRFLLTAGSETISTTFTEADAENGFITRTVSELASTATIAQINAATVEFEQTEYTLNGNLSDGLAIEIDCFDVQVNYDSPVTILSLPTVRAAPTNTLEDEWTIAAQDEYRSDIAVVPGSGPVRGIVQRKDSVFAFRDNVGGTACIAHIASASGWTTTGVTMADYVPFSAGLAAGEDVAVGDPIEGASSGATATVHRVVLNGGSVAWNGSGEGYIVLTDVVGGPFTSGESLESPSSTAIATASADSSTLAFSAGGKYQFKNHNFFASASSFRSYGVNNADAFAFEIDENGVISPIFLPGNPATDAGAPPAGNPYLVAVHRNHLFLAYPGGRFVHSVVGEPLQFSGFLGAAEFGVGDEITGLNSVVGNVLAITSERQTRGLFGANITDWEMKTIGRETGGRLYSLQTIDTVYGLDDLGITSVARTDAFGDFVEATLSKSIQPLLIDLRPNFTTSTIVRESNQYRTYYSDGTALVMFVPAGQNQSPQFGQLSYPFAVDTIFNGEDELGKERTYFATDDAEGEGFVFEDQIGRNFDGAPIRAFVRLPYYHAGSPSHRKRFRRADLELNAGKPVTLKVVSDLTFGNSDSTSGISDVTLTSGGGFYDVDEWDEIYWDGQDITTARVELSGTGENISLFVYNETEYSPPFILQGVTLHYDLRRLQR